MRASRTSVPLGLALASRPKQWVKNLLVFAAPGAAGVLSHRSVLGRTALAFASFCLLSSAMYLVNDVIDAPWDRIDPLKRQRPVATGVVSPPMALWAAGVLLLGGVTIGLALGWRFEVAVGAYVGLTIAYSLWLREVAVLDIGGVASGFVIRAIAGSLAVHVPLSKWFLILTSFGSLLIVAGKREADYARTTADEAELDVANGGGPRGSNGTLARTPAGRRPKEYTVAYLRYVWMMASAVSIAGYCLWSFEKLYVHGGVPWGELSVIPFVLAILRYELLLDAGHGGAPEDVILRDRPLQLLAVAWVVVYALGVYLGR